MRRPGNILLLAILIGALSAALAYRYFRQLRLELEAARGSANRPVVEVVVASQPITIGSRIEENQVKLVSWPIEAQPDGAFREMKAVVGSIAVTSIDKNEPVLQSQVVGQGAGLLPLMISEGMRGMSACVPLIACTMRLSAGLAGLSAGPLSPPLIARAAVSRRKPPFCFSAP